MHDADWQKIQEVLDLVLDAAPEVRRRVLDEECGEDYVLRTGVLRLLNATEAAAHRGGFFDDTATTFAAPLIAELGAAAASAAPYSQEIVAAALHSGTGGRYRIERELGRGGMATVYLGRDVRHDRAVAIKVLEGELTPGATERFLREIRTSAQLNHPHVVSLYDSGEADGILYFVMPHVEGETLRRRLARRQPIALDDALRFARELTDALAYAHAKGVVHRDLKPENILLSGGHAMIADFGIARALADADSAARARDGAAFPESWFATGLMGTPAYMAPEQFEDAGVVDQRTDLYALGVILYETITGQHPFGRHTATAFVPPALADLIAGLLQRDPAKRPQSAEQVGRALSAVTIGGRRRPPRPVVLAVIAVMLAVAGIAGFAMKPERIELASGETRGTRDQKAYDLYLAGRYYWLERGRENVARSIVQLRRAVQRDPNFARAHASLALSYATYPTYVPTAFDSMSALLAVHAQRAMDLDSTIADARLAYGVTLEYELRFSEALRHYRIALAREPSNATVYHWFGAALANVGEIEEAIQLLRRGSILDPMAKSLGTAYASSLVMAGRYEEAITAARAVLAIDSTFPLPYWALGYANALAGRPDQAIPLLERGQRLAPGMNGWETALLFAYTRAGRWEEAGRIRSRLTSPQDRAVASFLYGDPEPLATLLATPVGLRDWISMNLVAGCHPLLDSLWQETRFAAAMKQYGIKRCRIYQVSH